MRKTSLVILSLMFCSNCSATSSMDDYKKAKAQHQAIQVQSSVLDSKYVNLSKESIIDELGKPKEIIKDKFPYFINQDCRQDGCQLGYADEVWVYEFKDDNKGGIHSYQIGVYIKEGKVVHVGD